MSGKTALGRNGSAASAVLRVFTDHLGLLSDLTTGNDADFHSLRIYWRGTGDLLGVLKKYDDDGQRCVVFGGGANIPEVLASLERACDAQRWRVDKPGPWETEK